MKQLVSTLPVLGFLGSLLTAVASMAAQTEQEVIGEGAEDLPLFDAHIHYKSAAWYPYPPDTVVSMMDRNGVAMALVSSTPDEGTIALWKHAPNRIIPEMRPYTEHLGQHNWTKGEGIGTYIEQRLQQYPHEGIGEIHIHEIDQNDDPLMRRIAGLAMEKGIPLHVHSGREPVEYLYSLDPGLTIIWGHAGLNEPPEVVTWMMARYPTLYADTSYREGDILSDSEGIDPKWRRLLERFSDRFMLGSDTWTNDQWEDYDAMMADNRRWLAYLTEQTARRIAYQNAERLFNRTINAQLLGTR